jgi:hypothetical protein
MGDVAFGERSEVVRTLQTHLHELGLYQGRIDGDYGRKTLDAVASFQTGYLVTGRLDERSAAALLEVMERQHARCRHELSPPHGLAEVERAFGRIEYESTAGGSARIVNGWDELNIATVDLPVVGRVDIHRRMGEIFFAVFSDIDRDGLANEIRQFGTWSVRHKMHDPRRGLSTHSWGIAADINWARNPVGAIGTMHPEIVAIFEAHGFRWGGRFHRVRDDMHFQYCTGY